MWLCAKFSNNLRNWKATIPIDSSNAVVVQAHFSIHSRLPKKKKKKKKIEKKQSKLKVKRKKRKNFSLKKKEGNKKKKKKKKKIEQTPCLGLVEERL